MFDQPGAKMDRQRHKRWVRAYRKVAHRFGQVYQPRRVRRGWADAQDAKESVEAIEISYTPLDCGFDLRLHPEIAIELPKGERFKVMYCEGRQERVVEGSRAEVSDALVLAGYRVTQ